MLGANLASSRASPAAPKPAGAHQGHATARSRPGRRRSAADRDAERADEHFFIRPGTDVFWLAALLNVLFAEGLVDLGRLEPWVEGVDEIRALVADLTPERVAPICGIDAATTRREARALARAAAAAVYGRLGVHTVEFGTASAWLIACLNVLTDNFDRPGGVMTTSPVASRIDDREPGGRGWRMGRWKSRVSGRPEVNGELPAACLAEEMETEGEGRLRAALTIATNPVRSYPNSDRLDRAFADLEFHVAVDCYVNETTRHADVILPPPSALEEENYELTFLSNAVRSFAKYAPPVFEREGPADEDLYAKLALVLRGEGPEADPVTLHETLVREAVESLVGDPSSPIGGRDAKEILAALEGHSPVGKLLDLRLRTGWQGDLFGDKEGGISIAKLAEHPHGVDLGPMVERFPARLRTRSGRLELAPPELLADWKRVRAAFDQAVAAATAENGGSVEERSLRLIGRRHVRSNNSWMHNIEPLVSGRSRCTLLVHPEDAAGRGLVNGATCEVRSRVGRVRAEVETSEAMMPGVVSLPHGWGHDVEGMRMRVAKGHPGVPSNVLTDDARMDLASGNAVLNGIPVEVVPVAS
ncbi:MAG: molybdopterin dinucleotide binding domain-containing protein [Myxococcota bacterium]